MRNGTIGKVKDEENKVEIRGCGCAIFGIIASINLLLCTPIYFAIIAYLWAKVGGG